MPIFQLDSTGKAQANQVVGEGLIFASNIDKVGIAIIPVYGPFFMNGLTVRVRLTNAGSSGYPLNTDTPLKKWVDYIPILPYVDAADMLGQAIYGGVLLLDPNMSGSAQLTYQSLGGLTTPTVNQAAFNSSLDKSIFWTGYAEYFGVSQDLTGLKPVVDSLNKYTKTRLTSSIQDIENKLAALSSLPSDIDYSTHAADARNPHNVTPTQLGLEKVPNWATANSSDALAGTSRSLFVTPASAAVAVTNRTSVPLATDTAAGTVTLNLGASASDGADATKTLTTAGLLSLLAMQQSNQIKNLFSTQRQQLFFTPKPTSYPKVCLGKTCYNFQDLVSAVASTTGLVNIQSSDKLGCIWLPYDYPTNSLNLGVS